MEISEEEYRAEEDAKTLIEYQRIIADKKRREKAKEVLKDKKEEIKKALDEKIEK